MSARSALECGRPLPLLTRSLRSVATQSVRGLAQSKTWRRFAASVVLLLATAAPLIAQGSYSIAWFTMDGGGGTSTGGVFTVTGTIGQPDAGKMSGGNYSIDGGFWGVIAAVPTPGAPSLTIARTTTNSVIISWPSPSTGWKLQQNGNLSTTNWTDVLTTPDDDGTTKSVTVAPPVGNRFYRLNKP